MICAKCGAENESKRTFCQSCGAILSFACPYCGAHIYENAVFCESCGNSIDHSADEDTRLYPTSNELKPLFPTSPLTLKIVLFGTYLFFAISIILVIIALTYDPLSVIFLFLPIVQFFIIRGIQNGHDMAIYAQSISSVLQIFISIFLASQGYWVLILWILIQVITLYALFYDTKVRAYWGVVKSTDSISLKDYLLQFKRASDEF